METQRRILYRSSKEPSVALPFGARSSGHYQVEPGYREKPAAKAFLQLFWGIEGEGKFVSGSQELILKPRHVFIYLPGDVHDVTARTSWRYRWFTLDGSLNEQIARSFGLSRGCKLAGACPEELFVQLENEIQDVTPMGERMACATAFALLAAAAGERSPAAAEDRRVDEAIRMIETHFSRPEFGVEALAANLHLHRSLLCRLFRQKTGRSPVEYLINIRLQKALSLLKSTNLSVQEIARQTGYRDPNYFCKAMKKTAGAGPTEFRKA